MIGFRLRRFKEMAIHNGKTGLEIEANEILKIISNPAN